MCVCVYDVCSLYCSPLLTTNKQENTMRSSIDCLRMNEAITWILIKFSTNSITILSIHGLMAWMNTINVTMSDILPIDLISTNTTAVYSPFLRIDIFRENMSEICMHSIITDWLRGQNVCVLFRLGGFQSANLWGNWTVLIYSMRWWVNWNIRIRNYDSSRFMSDSIFSIIALPIKFQFSAATQKGTYGLLIA